MQQSKFTIEERNAIYKKALLAINGEVNLEFYSLDFLNIKWQKNSAGLCELISLCANSYSGKINATDYPEVFLFKPASHSNTLFWFSKEDRETRKVILEFCIEITS